MSPLANPLPHPEPVEQISDIIGQLMEFWGFKHIMGRIWAILFFSSHPLSQSDIAARLHASTGAVSMGLRDLLAWGAIHKVCPSGSRKEHYVSEDDIWKMVRRVLSEREGRRIENALFHLDQAIQNLQGEKHTHHSNLQERRYQIEKLEELRKLGNLGRHLLKLLLIRAKVDVTPLQDFFSNPKTSERSLS